MSGSKRQGQSENLLPEWVDRILTLLFSILVALYFIHLVFVGGFKDSAVMLADDFNVLRSCPGKPGVLIDFILRDDKDTYTYWVGWDKNIIDLSREGAFEEVCDKSPGVF